MKPFKDGTRMCHRCGQTVPSEDTKPKVTSKRMTPGTQPTRIMR